MSNNSLFTILLITTIKSNIPPHLAFVEHDKRNKTRLKQFKTLQLSLRYTREITQRRGIRRHKADWRLRNYSRHNRRVIDYFCLQFENISTNRVRSYNSMMRGASLLKSTSNKSNIDRKTLCSKYSGFKWNYAAGNWRDNAGKFAAIHILLVRHCINWPDQDHAPIFYIKNSFYTAFVLPRVALKRSLNYFRSKNESLPLG